MAPSNKESQLAPIAVQGQTDDGFKTDHSASVMKVMWTVEASRSSQSFTSPCANAARTVASSLPGATRRRRPVAGVNGTET